MDSEKRQACEQIIASLKSLYGSGTIGEKQYYKSIISVAYEYAKNDDLNECMSLLSVISPEFIFNELQSELENDSLFMDVTYNLSKILEKFGVVIMEPEFPTNMSPAKA